MLELLIGLSQDLGARYDLAAVNFLLSWAGALAGVALMAMTARRRTMKTASGRIAWAKTCAVFWTTIVLALGGSYPVHLGAQPWLPSVLLTGAVLVLLVAGIAGETGYWRGGGRHQRKNAMASRKPAAIRTAALASSQSHSGMAALLRRKRPA
jgi:hypothetical protein